MLAMDTGAVVSNRNLGACGNASYRDFDNAVATTSVPQNGQANDSAFAGGSISAAQARTRSSTKSCTHGDGSVIPWL